MIEIDLCYSKITKNSYLLKYLFLFLNVYKKKKDIRLLRTLLY